MKKSLVILMTLLLAFAVLSVTVAAAPSKQGGLISESATGVDVNGNQVQVKVVKSTNKDISPFETEFQKIKGQNDSVNMLAHVDVTAVGDTSLLEFPLTVTIPVSGATSETTGYFLLKKSDGTIVVLDAIMGDGTATADFPELGEVVFVSDMDAESEIEIGSPEDSKKDDEPTEDEPSEEEEEPSDEPTEEPAEETDKPATDDSKEATDKTSDKTSDGVVPFVALMTVSALALGVSAKKLFVK